MSYIKISYEKQGELAIIRLNDPDVLNAMGPTMMKELDDAIAVAAGSARALLLTGVGRAFCSGGNMSDARGAGGYEPAADLGTELETIINPLMIRISQLPIPFISAVRGAAAGIGCSFALIADIVLASETAFFMQAFARIGLVPDAGSSWLLSRAIGRTRAMEMMLLGERIDAAKALEWGLINRVTPDDELDQAALNLATKLAEGPTRSLAMIREAAWAAADQNFVKVLANERRLQRDAGRTRDHREGVTAFLEKRKPRFTGI
ncbi:enoyl-CoA hydratase-related protein [Flavisphingomonas formosensis]|uniref:enoyl-CoA hydratase-related protein n=1 Tax=Flavisphingomonas formosensis TaxID=861534 RepID=UPI0012FC7D06|nr:enoyl-CoA hydratase-related protein [Sphingomonas formosensis]